MDRISNLTFVEVGAAKPFQRSITPNGGLEQVPQKGDIISLIDTADQLKRFAILSRELIEQPDGTFEAVLGVSRAPTPVTSR